MFVRFLQAVCHLVERLCEIANFVLRFHGRPLGKLALCDCPGRIDEFVYRPKNFARQPPGQNDGPHQRCQEDPSHERNGMRELPAHRVLRGLADRGGCGLQLLGQMAQGFCCLATRLLQMEKLLDGRQIVVRIAQDAVELPLRFGFAHFAQHRLSHSHHGTAGLVEDAGRRMRSAGQNFLMQPLQVDDIANQVFVHGVVAQAAVMRQDGFQSGADALLQDVDLAFEGGSLVCFRDEFVEKQTIVVDQRQQGE